MPAIETTDAFDDWMGGLAPVVQARIAARLRKLERGLWGDSKSVGAGVTELREHFGAGYRVYVTERGAELVIVLGGGDKSSQQRDIDRAILLVKQL